MTLSLPDHVTVVDVSPRDGLQSLDKWIDTDHKIRMIDHLSDAGFPVIEVTSFVHPKVVPNLADAEQVIAGIKRRPGTVYRALVANKRGVLRALDTDIDEVLGLMTVSESYLRKNQNMSLEQVIEVNRDVFQLADGAGRSFMMAIGVCMHCPYEGLIPMEQTIECIRQLRNHGIKRFYLAASTGWEEPRQVYSLFQHAMDNFPDCEFGFHLHEKMGLASANLLAALQAGVTQVEGSICGIGGGMAFPDGSGAIGNLPSEDIVHFLDAMGVKTDLSPDTLQQTAVAISELLNVAASSRVVTMGTRVI